MGQFSIVGWVSFRLPLAAFAATSIVALAVVAIVMPSSTREKALIEEPVARAAGAVEPSTNRVAATDPTRSTAPPSTKASHESPPPELPLLGTVRSFTEEHTSGMVRALEPTALDTALARVVELQRALKLEEGKVRAELSGPAHANLFQVSGEIKQRQADRVVIWGYAIPENTDSRQLGSHMQESNLLVEAPPIEGIIGGIHYQGTHAYLRESSGTNAFGASVPVSVYGAIPPSLTRRQESLQARLTTLAEASRGLGAVYTRIRRAVIAVADGHREPYEAIEPVVRALDALVSTSIDENEFSTPERHWQGMRILLDQGTELRRPGSSFFERGFAKAGTVLGFTDASFVARWFTRIYERTALAAHFPEDATPFLQSVEGSEQPVGIEGLMNVLMSKEHSAASGLSTRYRVSMKQHALCPELVQVSLQPLAVSSAWGEVVLLAKWNGNRSTLLAATFRPRSAGAETGVSFFDLESSPRDPMNLNWPR